MNDTALSLRFGPISPAAPGPLYDQIIVAVKREVSAGRLQAGEALPSVRGLAAGLLVSVITVKRAYDELEREGILFSRPGLGTFVAERGIEHTQRLERDTAREALRAAIAAGREGGLSDADIVALLEEELSQGGNK